MKIFSIVFILLLLAAFITFELYGKSDNIVLRVQSPNVLQIDLNNNRIVDDGETFCVAGLETFTSNLLISQDVLADKYKLSIQDAIAIGYLTDNYTKKLLTNQNVNVKFKDEILPNCRYAEIYLNGEKYAEKLYNEGYGIYNGKVSEKFYKNLEQATKLKLVILNHKSNKYHKLDCEYGLISHDAVVIKSNELPKDAVHCKFCHPVKSKIITHKNKSFSTTPPPAFMTSGSIKFLLTDFTTQLKPDNKCISQVCRSVLEEINGAQKTIDMAVYGWDKVEELEEAFKNAVKRGVKIRLVYDETSGGNSYYADTKNLIAIASEHKSDRIPYAGETDYIMHNKFLIIDNKKVLTGSMNYSKTGISGFNSNNLIFINSTEIANLYTEEFEKMLNGKFHNTKSQSVLQRTFVIGSSIVSVYFSPQDKIITNHLIKLIDDADKYIFIPAFLITHKGFVSSLINAHSRGVDIKIIVDAANANIRHSALKTLRNAGIMVKVENYAGKMHNKSIIIDDKYIVTGSMNFSNSGENKNDENVLILEDTGLAIFYRDFFNYIWEKIPDKYLKQNPRPEGWESVGSCQDGIDNNFNGKIDLDDIFCGK